MFRFHSTLLLAALMIAFMVCISGYAQQVVTRELTIDKQYLLLPVRTGAAKQRVKYLVDGKTAREFDIELDGENPSFWVFSDVSGFNGKKLTIETSAPQDAPGGLDAIQQSDTLPGAETMYHEATRPQFHFTSRRGWNNDPNGLVFFQGEYHLYYQHNPFGWNWGNMHWGHAVSPDLIHWKELPIALYPRQYNDWCFSGSAVIDEKNTSEFGQGGEPPLIAAYTSTGRGECIAFSLDRGRTFHDYEGNPVVKHQGRDPKVIWYKPGQHWVMAVYDEMGDSKGIAFYTSPDLKEWTRQSRIEGYYECPELFEIPIEGKTETKWIVYAADGAYTIGQFDGKTFTPETDKLPYNYGDCFYASQTYNNIPESDGRRIQIGWGRTGDPAMPFNQQMNFPVELTLRETDDGLRLFAWPIREINTLYDKLRVKKTRVTPDEPLIVTARGDLFDVTANIELMDASEVGFIVRGMPVSYDVKSETLRCGDNTAPLKAPNGFLSLRLLVDRQSVEIFGGDGRVYMPMSATFKDDTVALDFYCKGGAVRADSIRAAELKSIWPSENE
ncbi:MAG: 2,6-beta-D-fructofuranosidase [bacterium]|nr:2,6-beta-D-fructofuranosidase [bacterium]